MSNIDTPVIHGSATKAAAVRYLSCLRPQDILVLQGSPLLGAAFALRNPEACDLAPLAILMVANLFLVTHIFMLNDWSGLRSDLTDPNKVDNVFTARGVGRGEIRSLTVGFLIVSLFLFSWLGSVTIGISLAIAILSALYSLPRFNWKGRPILNSLTHLAGGSLHFLLGYSLGSVVDQRGFVIALFFGLIFAAGHLTQEVRDYQGDVMSAIRTNAVTFGPRRTFAASLVFFTLANIVFVVLALEGILPRPLAVLVAVFPVQLYWSFESLREGLNYASTSRLQARYRLLYAVIGLAMMAALLVGPR